MYLSLSPNSFLYWRHARLCENRILRIRLGDFHLHGKLAFSILFEYSIKISNVRLMDNDQLLPRMSYRFVSGLRCTALTNCRVNGATVKDSIPEGPHVPFGVLITVAVIFQQRLSVALQLFHYSTLPLINVLEDQTEMFKGYFD